MIFGREPVAIIATAHALIALAIGFGLHLSTEQFALIEAALTAVLALVARRAVTPNATVDEHDAMTARLRNLEG